MSKNKTLFFNPLIPVPGAWQRGACKHTGRLGTPCTSCAHLRDVGGNQRKPTRTGRVGNATHSGLTRSQLIPHQRNKTMLKKNVIQGRPVCVVLLLGWPTWFTIRCGLLHNLTLIPACSWVTLCVYQGLAFAVILSSHVPVSVNFMEVESYFMHSFAMQSSHIYPKIQLGCI